MKAMAEKTQGRSRLFAFALPVLGVILAFALLYLARLYSYLLFHGLVEAFSVAVAFSIFAIAFNSRRFHGNSFLLFLGAAYLGVSLIHLLHMLAYKGMGVFTSFDANLSTQLWIAARYLESLALLIAPFLLILRCPMRRIFLGISIVTAALLASIFARVFPICYIEGMGLTPFKRISEYLVCLIMLAAIWVAWRYRDKFEPRILRLYSAAIAIGILAEIPFTLYVGVYDLPNLLGHYLKLLSFYLLYRAVIATGLSRPQEFMFRDLAQREQALEKVNAELKAEFAERQRAERSFRQLFQHMNSGVVIVRAVEEEQDFVIEDVNPAVERIERATRTALIGKRLSEFATTAAPSPIRLLAQQVWKTGQDTYVPEAIGARADGFGQVWREVWAYHFPDNEIVMLYNDITERKEAEKRLREQDILAAIGQLAAGTAHEINNRLTAMMGLAELVQTSPQLPEETRRDMHTIIQEGERGAKLIRQLLDFGRKSLISQRIWNLRELLRELDNSLAREQDVRLESLDLVSGWQIKLDKTRIQSAIENLIRNAREAMPADGEVHIRLAPLTVAATEPSPAPDMPLGRYLAISVSDRGGGISAETRAHLFEPFFTTKERALHPGLGLPQAYGIVKEHGGFVAIQDREGGGTTVSLYLPAL
jgi:PAS domain S-box-containing protein